MSELQGGPGSRDHQAPQVRSSATNSQLTKVVLGSQIYTLAQDVTHNKTNTGNATNKNKH